MQKWIMKETRNKQKRIYCEAELNFCNFLIGRVVHIHPDGGCFDTDFSA
jgi:hypothetical protein